jgi:hypothetical protein
MVNPTQQSSATITSATITSATITSATITGITSAAITGKSRVRLLVKGASA